MKNLIATFALVALVAGCGRQEAEPAATAVKPYADMSDADVLVTVNGKSLTKGDVEKEAQLQKALQLTVSPRAKLDRIEPKLRRLRMSSVNRFVSRQILLAEADRRGVKADASAREEIQRRFMSKVFQFRRMKFEDLSKKMAPKFCRQLEADLEADARLESLRKALRDENRYEATAKEAEARAEKMQAYNARMAKLEAGIYHDATNAWERVQAGEKMEAAVERIVASGNEHVEADMDWGSFELSFFDEYPQVRKFLSVMPVGTVSPPVEGDNGLMIFKLLDVENPLEPNGHVRYHLARIFFQLPEFYPNIAGEELRKRISEEMTERAVNDVVAKLKAKAEIRYPNGSARQIFSTRGGKGAKQAENTETKGNEAK